LKEVSGPQAERLHGVDDAGGDEARVGVHFAESDDAADDGGRLPYQLKHELKRPVDCADDRP